MNDLPTRRDLAVVDADRRGNPRHLVVVDPEPTHAEIVEVQAPQLPTRPTASSRVVAQVEGS